MLAIVHTSANIMRNSCTVGQVEFARIAQKPDKQEIKMARQEGFEPATYGLEGRCSIQLSYWRAWGPQGKATAGLIIPHRAQRGKALFCFEDTICMNFSFYSILSAFVWTFVQIRVDNISFPVIAVNQCRAVRWVKTPCFLPRHLYWQREGEYSLWPRKVFTFLVAARVTATPP